MYSHLFVEDPNCLGCCITCRGERVSAIHYVFGLAHLTSEVVNNDTGEVWITKDSGKREQFTSGMVRDTQEGKPRFDLIFDGPLTRQILIRLEPLKTVLINAFFDWYESPTIEKATITILELSDFFGGLSSFFDDCSGLMVRGAIKYTEKNWMLASGEPELKRFKSSACRHFGQYILRNTDENHGAAVWFNLNGFHYVESKLNAK